MDITIIIPAYNRIWALPRAIESCKDDSGLAVQVIVVDDGSTDGTWEMLNKTTGIEIYRQQHWGKPWAVNYAFDRAKGKYIKFLDSDDWLVKGSLRKEFDLAERETADVVVAGYHIYKDDQLIRTQEWVLCDDFIAQNLGECDSSHYSAFLFRKDFIKDIPHRTSFASADFASRDDRCFMLEVALKEPKIAISNEPALCHTHHTKGRLQFPTRLAAGCTNYQHLLIYQNIIHQLRESNRLTQRRIDASMYFLWPICYLIAKSDIETATRTFNWLKELNPHFKISQDGFLGFLYRKMGFKNASIVLEIRRKAKSILKMKITK